MFLEEALDRSRQKNILTLLKANPTELNVTYSKLWSIGLQRTTHMIDSSGHKEAEESGI